MNKPLSELVSQLSAEEKKRLQSLEKRDVYDMVGNDFALWLVAACNLRVDFAELLLKADVTGALLFDSPNLSNFLEKRFPTISAGQQETIVAKVAILKQANPLAGSSASMSDSEKLSMYLCLLSCSNLTESNVPDKLLAIVESMQRQQAKEPLQFSSVSGSKWVQLRALIDVGVVYETEPVASGTAVAPLYHWDPVATEDKHEETFVDATGKVLWQGYREWLRKHLEIPASMQLVSTKSIKHLLEFSAGPFAARGNTDLIMLPAFSADNPGLWTTNAVILFEIKKTPPPGEPIPSSWEFQAFLEVLSASAVGAKNPFVILTDLRHLWRLYWFAIADGAQRLVRRDASFGEVQAVVKTYAAKYSDPETFNAEHKRSSEYLPEIPIIKRARYPIKKSDVADLDDIEPEGTAHVLRAMQQLQAMARMCHEYDMNLHASISPEARPCAMYT